MAVHNNRSLTLDRRSTKRPPAAESLRPLGQRLVNFFRGTNDHDRQPEAPQPPGWIDQEQWPMDDVLPRFPVVRQGYDCTAVDAHVAELERELSEVDRELAALRSQPVSRDEVASELKRVGEQTSAVLIAANEKRGQILREAQEEADRSVAEASATARAITEESEMRLRELQVQHEAVQQERERLLEEVRGVSRALAALADPAQQPASSQPAEASGDDELATP